MKNPLAKLGSAHVIAVAALVVASSGTAYAAATIGSAQIIDNSVRSADIKDETVRSQDLRNGTVGEADLSDTAKSSLSANHIRVDGTMVTAAGGAHVSATHNCDYEHGELATGGGGYSYYAANGYLTKTTPVYGAVGTAYEGKPIGWTASMQNLSGSTNYLVLRVMCATA